MKKLFLILFLSAMGAIPWLTGCVENPPSPHHAVSPQHPPAEVEQPQQPTQIIAVAPPKEPPMAPMVPAPGPQYVYVPGYWAWEGKWVWVQGKWYVPPQPNAKWKPGRWVYKNKGYVWEPGRWS